MAATDLHNDRFRHSPRRSHRPSVREIAVDISAARWAQRKLSAVAGGIDHERRVLAIAEKLADLTDSILHLTDSQRQLLRLSALLHDVGRSIDERNHPREGAAMILATSAVDLTAAERRQLAFLTRYHRGAVPPAGKEEHLTAADDRAALDTVLALLRAADGLDNRQLPPLELTFSLTGRRLKIDAAVSSELRRARHVFTRRKKFRLLETALGQSIAIDVHRAAAAV